MPLTPEQKCDINAIMAEHGIDTVLREVSYMIADNLSGLSDDLTTIILCNANDVMKAADSITYRAYTGRDLYQHDIYSTNPPTKELPS